MVARTKRVARPILWRTVQSRPHPIHWPTVWMRRVTCDRWRRMASRTCRACKEHPYCRQGTWALFFFVLLLFDWYSPATSKSTHIVRVSNCISFGFHSQQSDQSGDDGGNYASVMGASYVNNGGGQRPCVGDEDKMFMMFSPAEHTDSMKRRKEKKRRERRERSDLVEQKTPEARDKESPTVVVTPPHTTTTSSSQASGSRSPRPGSITPTTQNVTGRNVSPRHQLPESSSPISSAAYYYSPKDENASSPLRGGATPESPRQGSPSARPPRPRGMEELPADDDDVWYAKWWMLCFPDAIKSVSTKR